MATANAIFAPGQPKKSAPLPLRGRKPPTFPKSERRRPLLPKPKQSTARPFLNRKTKDSSHFQTRKVKSASPFQTKAACRPPLSKPKNKGQRLLPKPKQSAAPAAFCTKKEEFCLHLSQNRAAARAIFESLLKSKEMCAILYPVNIWIGRKILCLFKSRG